MGSILRVATIFFVVCIFSAWVGGPGLLREGHAQTASPGSALANIRTDPPTPRTGDRVRLLFDPTESVVRAEIAWSINGKEVQNSEYDFANKIVELNHPIKAGDVIVATITPYEAGGSQGKAVEHRVVCGNAPPELTVVNQAIRDGVYTAKVEAKNPQGGTVSLKLEEAPSGLAMDQSGNIVWKLAANKAGRFTVKVVGEDEFGQKAYLSYEIGIRWQ